MYILFIFRVKWHDCFYIVRKYFISRINITRCRLWSGEEFIQEALWPAERGPSADLHIEQLETRAMWNHSVARALSMYYTPSTVHILFPVRLSPMKATMKTKTSLPTLIPYHVKIIKRLRLHNILLKTVSTRDSFMWGSIRKKRRKDCCMLHILKGCISVSPSPLDIPRSLRTWFEGGQIYGLHEISVHVGIAIAKDTPLHSLNNPFVLCDT